MHVKTLRSQKLRMLLLIESWLQRGFAMTKVASADLQHQIDKMLELEIVHARRDVDTVAGVEADMVFRDAAQCHTARSGALAAKRTARPRALVCVGPIRYIGHNELYADREPEGFAPGRRRRRSLHHYNRQVDASVDDCRKFIALRVETLNHGVAIRGSSICRMNPASVIAKYSTRIASPSEDGSDEYSANRRSKP
jgi:hypothetical protein